MRKFTPCFCSAPIHPWITKRLALCELLFQERSWARIWALWPTGTSSSSINNNSSSNRLHRSRTVEVHIMVTSSTSQAMPDTTSRKLPSWAVGQGSLARPEGYLHDCQLHRLLAPRSPAHLHHCHFQRILNIKGGFFFFPFPLGIPCY